MKNATLTFTVSFIALSLPSLAQHPPGEEPALGFDRMTQDEVENGGLPLDVLRKAGLKIFATNFNKLDGYGDGPQDPSDPTSPGGRPTLQNNGTFLRVNGLDAQSCMECHSVGSSATVPFTFAVGGVGGSNNNALFQPKEIDVDDSFANGFAFYDGRYINPPFLFGSGGVELLGKEMTTQLQLIKERAQQVPDVPFALQTHGVDFGTILYDSGAQDWDTSGVEGIDADLVVRPFGRKGEFPTVRAFDIGALAFHFGMQAIEDVGQGVDADGDGVVDEVLTGELSALHIFNTNLERPQVRGLAPAGGEGAQLFQSMGCAACHVPSLESYYPTLEYAFPEVETDPRANVYYATNLHDSPAGFDLNGHGGLSVPLFSDLKRHDMGPALEESFGSPLDAQFITARLWGVADTAPYLHDGRATTLTEAILLHGGEAQAARDAFDQLSDPERRQVLSFLRALRTPRDPASDLF